MNKAVYTMDTLPEIMTAQHIATYMGISRARVYELLKLRPVAGGIPCINIGATKRVCKDDFVEWLDSKRKEKMTG